MNGSVLHIAVVGHTNTGKTSLLRTLTRNARFGQVDDNPGTTRHVEGARLSIDGAAVLEWFDTPGMEDSIALREYVEQLCSPDPRLDGPAQVQRFLDSPEAHRRFEQEARVLEKMQTVDAALYVIDARDPVWSKHLDELALLAACGKPLLPVLNFVQGTQHRAEQWRGALARLGLHAQVEFDTIAPPLDGEAQLYGKLAVLLDRHAEALSRLVQDLGEQRRMRRQTARRLTAELLVDVAALRLSSAGDAAAEEETARRLRGSVRQREQGCVDALLALYNFRREDYAEDTLPLSDQRWGMDLFHPQTLKNMGVQLGVGAAAGAVAGAAVDLFTAGLSLGAGMLIGAAAGGLWQGVDRFGKRMAGRVRGHRELTVDDAVLRLLALRQGLLIQALERRGHAARQPVAIAQPGDEAWRKHPLPDEIQEARSRPEWSALTPGYADDARRKIVIAALAARLEQTQNPPP
jgi:hypothetical protein